jgi:hypothetical protein
MNWFTKHKKLEYGIGIALLVALIVIGLITISKKSTDEVEVTKENLKELSYKALQPKRIPAKFERVEAKVANVKQGQKTCERLVTRYEYKKTFYEISIGKNSCAIEKPSEAGSLVLEDLEGWMQTGNTQNKLELILADGQRAYIKTNLSSPNVSQVFVEWEPYNIKSDGSIKIELQDKI